MFKVTYTIKDLTKSFNISIRTLRFYDEIGLLKPARRGQNLYRYYEEEHFLRLEKILFYKEIGLELSIIRTLLEGNSSVNVQIFQKQKQILLDSILHSQELIVKIDLEIKNSTDSLNQK